MDSLINKPCLEDLDLNGIKISGEDLQKLLDINKEVWQKEIVDIEKHFAQFGERLPSRLRRQLED